MSVATNSIDINNSWTERTPTGRALGKMMTVIVPVCFFILFMVLLSITGQLITYIIPSLFSWATPCNDIFTANGTIYDWYPCNGGRGAVTLVFMVVDVSFINLMLLPLYFWLKINNQNRIISIIVTCMIPFYIFGLELMGAMAVKIKGNHDMSGQCNLESYYGLMNTDCLFYGIAVELIILAIEIGIAIIFASIFTLLDYIRKPLNHQSTNSTNGENPKPLGSAGKTTDDTVVELETDPQLTSGKINTKIQKN